MHDPRLEVIADLIRYIEELEAKVPKKRKITPREEFYQATLEEYDVDLEAAAIEAIKRKVFDD